MLTFYHKLASVNACWLQQHPSILATLPAVQPRSEAGWIQLHLSLVEKALRAHSPAGLSAAQLEHRNRSLDDLHQYWLAGNFPQNEDYAYRTPIFIDKHDNFCAVGYLVKASGFEAVSRNIAARTNLAYVKEMHYPELQQWASDHGFTIDELAWIQPGYPPRGQAMPVGNGVDGTVFELMAEQDQKLYVGGSFTTVDGVIPAANIAYVTEAAGSYTWHAMGGGVDGPVHAIAAYDGKVFVAGSFTQAGDQAAHNVAYWDGSGWHAAGCTYGTIRDLAVYKGELYACGSFDVCAAMSEVNFARWNGTSWQQLPGLTGKVNTLEVRDNDLLLGGAFSWQDQPVNLIRWNEDSFFQPFANGSLHEVRDFASFEGSMYAVCGMSIPQDTNALLLKLQDNAWSAPGDFQMVFEGALPSINTLCPDGDRLMAGGSFRSVPLMGTYAYNSIVLRGNQDQYPWFLVDSTIHTMVQFKDKLYAGGAFRHGGEFVPATLNGMMVRSLQTVGIENPATEGSLACYPNPLAAGRLLMLENNIDATDYILTDITGRKIAAGKLVRDREQLSLPGNAKGTYMLSIHNEKGQRMHQKLVIR